tara:strand:+ start:967 stop:1692 length:726 start_codon:yes stop_codon:yes gene_type:complete
MKNREIILKWILVLFLIGILWVLLFSLPNTYSVNNKVVVKYVGKYNQSMNSKDEIMNSAMKFLNAQDSLNKDINTQLLEDLITQDEYVEKAEVYLDVTGAINIYVYFRKPFVRLLRDNEVYYYDSEKVMLPALSNVDDNLLVVTGHLDQDNFEQLFFLVKMIYNHEFLNEHIGGVHYDKDLGYTLSSKICDLGINIGKNPLFDTVKIEMIKVFYTFLGQELNCDYCKSIDIQYDKQIICIK